MHALTYLYLSVFVGLAQVADAVALHRSKGKCGVAQKFFSVFEYIWAFVSFGMLEQSVSPNQWRLAFSFVAYVSSFFAIGMLLAAQKKTSDFPLPKSIFISGGVFGLFFGGASAYLALQSS
jgi:hypothetical protein